VDVLLLLLLLLLLVPLGVVVLFVKQGQLSRRLDAAESELADMREALAERRAVPAAEAPAHPPVFAPPPPEPTRQAWTEFVAPPGPAAAEPEEPGEADREPETVGAIFERLVAGRLLIWLGGVALITAAFFLIRYSIEVGLLTPEARMLGAAAFGLLLIAAGEYARAGRFLAEEPRIAQALVGAGIVVLYATAYGSHVLYGLIGARTATIVMLLVSGAALFLSLRHGAATALMGLIGGFLTPALVGDQNAGAVPLLLYLAAINVAVFAIAWRRGWTWLAATSVALSFVWTGYLLGRPADDARAAGMFVIALAVAAALLRPGGGRQLVYVQPLAIAAIELAVLVARNDLGVPAWTMFGMLAAASVALVLLRPEHRFAPPVALGLLLILIASKAAAGQEIALLPWAAAAATLLFAGFALALAHRGDRLLRTGLGCAALAGPVLILRALQPELAARPLWGSIMLALALGALLLAWLQRHRAGGERPDLALLLVAGTGALLLGGAVYDLLPPQLVAVGWTAVALGFALIGRRFGERAFTAVSLGAALVAALRAAAMVPQLWTTATASVLGMPALASALPTPLDALSALVLPAVLLAAIARITPAGPAASRALAAAACLFALAAAYIFAKQPFAISGREEFVALGLAERTAITQALFLVGWLLSSGRVPLRWLDRAQAAWLGSIVTFVAAARLIWFDLFLHNPVLDDQWVGTMPVLNLLVPAYLLSAFWLYDARRRADAETRSGFWLVTFLAALIAGVMLVVRQLFHGPILAGGGMPIAEVYGYSLAGLLLSLALLLAGIRLPDKALRLAGLVLLTATILKVFLSDASALEGILRILSFLGLGVALIGIGRLYGPVLRAESGASAQS
jgi:uncharacterized membrane protein